MSNFDDERQNVENQTYDRFKETGKIGAKVTYKAGKKITTKAGKKLLARKGYKKFTGGMIKGAKAIGKGIMSLGKAFIAAIKALIAIFLSWGWIILLILAVAVLFWVLMPALKQYTFNSTNQEPGVFETNIKLSDENKSYDNYFQYYSDKSLTQNKVAIFYNDVDYRKTGRELFDELNEKKYILGPRKPTQIVPPTNTGNSGGSNGDIGSEIPGGTIIGEGATKALLEEAQKHLGKKYVWGGKGPNNFDCSGFVYYCMNQIGANMQYHTSSALRKELQYKDRSELQPGDFVFYHKGTSSTTYHTVDHVAIYMGKINGEDKIIHSSHSEGKVCIQKLPSNSAKRVYTYGRWPGLPLPGEDENSKEENSNSTEKSKSITLFDNIFSKTKTSNNSENTSLKKPNDITVVIDAGHGGSESGAVNKKSGTKEKDINLSVAKLLEGKLKQEGYKTIMTRTDDVDVSISDRYKISNQYGDVFISIHCNAVKSTSARGGLTVYWKDKDFAEYIQDGFIKAVNIKDRGANHVNELGREEGIGVLQNAKKPAALVELAFISNPDDEKLLTSSDFQQKAANGIAQGLNNYVNKVPIDTSSKDPNYNGGSSSSNSYEIIKTLKEMEGFISEETIDKLQQYWESKANPTLGWDWDTDELRKELNELINYSYDIEKFEKIDTNKLTHLKQEQLSTKVELKDKYNRERYFNITPELLYSLNSSLYKEEFMHTNVLIKPVKTKMVNGKLQLDANAFILDNDKELNSLAKDEAWYKDEKDLSNEFKESISSYLKTDEEKEEEKENNDKKNKKEEDFNKYGLGTVFVYRPVITFNIERGIEINQTAQSSESTTTNEEGETVTSITLNSKPSGRVIDNIDCKIEYVLDRAITFSGEYVFKYEQVVNVLEEKNVEQILSEDGITTGNLIQSKKYEITEVPSDIVLQNKGRTYLSNYLGNFKASIPTDIMNGFNERRLIEAFKEYNGLGEKTSSTTTNNQTTKPGLATEEEFKNAVFMGDSLTVGLKENVDSIKVHATGGHKVSQGVKAHLQDVINEKPPIVVLSFGTNDAAYEEKEIDTFKKDYKDLISKLKSEVPNVKIYVNKIFPGDDTKSTNNDIVKKSLKNIPAYNNALNEIVSESQVTLIDCTTIPNLKSYYSDSLHLTGTGYKLWYEEMRKKIINGATTTDTTTLDSNVNAKIRSTNTSTSSLVLPPPREGEERSLADVLSIGSKKDGQNVKKALNYLSIFQKYGEMYGIDPYLLVAKSATESSGNPNADNGAAKGLMQIEHTVKSVQAYNHSTGQVDKVNVDRSRLYEPEYNIHIGTMELASRGADSNYNILAALQGYNFGPAGIKFAIQYYLSGGNLTVNDNYDNDRVVAYMASNHIGWLTAQYPGDLPKEKQYSEANSNDGKHNARMWYSNTGFKKYNQGAGTPVHLERVLAHYPGTGSPWFKDKDGNIITLDGSMVGNSSVFAENESLPKAIKEYDAYEENGWFGKMSRFSTSLSSDKVELTLSLATAMKEEISMTDVKDGNYSYWDDDYIKNNFVSGLPKGRNFKDYDRGKNSNKDWKKILDTVSYIRQNIGARSIGKMNILNTSAVIGHAYEVNAKLKVPKTPLAIKQKIKLKVNGEEEIQLGDILLLETKVLDEDLEGIHPYVIETAIFVGEEDGENKYAIVNNNRLVLMDINTIQELYNIDSIVRPISNEYSGDEDSSSNSNQISTTGGEWAWPTTTNVISSDFGPRNIKKGSNPHKGIDIVDVLDGNHLEGTNVPILASKDGVVHHVSHTDSSNAGVYVVLEHSDGTLSEYMHLKPGSTSHVKVGQSFKQGEQVGIMGTTGTSSGIHLHFSIKSLDKDKFKDIEATYPGSVLQGLGNYYFVDPELVLSKPANLKVYRGGGKWNLSYQN